MTVAEWLETREPSPPPALASRVAELALAEQGTDPSSVCLAAAEKALGALVRAGESGRAAALDLLAVDALVTYAFEAAADDPERIPALATAAMAGLSRAIKA